MPFVEKSHVVKTHNFIKWTLTRMKREKNWQCQQRPLIKFPKNSQRFVEFVFEASIFILKINLISFGQISSPTTSAFRAPEFWEWYKNAKNIFVCLSSIWCDPIMGEKKIPNSASAFSLHWATNEIKRANFLGRRKT